MRIKGKIKTLSSLIFAAIAVVARGECDLSAIFAESSAWDMTAVDFTIEHKDAGFKFASKERNIVNSLVKGSSRWCGFPVWEAKVYFGRKGVERLELSLYNRGDDTLGSDMSVDKLIAMLGEIESKVIDKRKSRNLKTQRREVRGEGVRFTRELKGSSPFVVLDWGINGKLKKEQSVEFLRATVTRAKRDESSVPAKKITGKVAIEKVKKNVTKNDEGDIWIKNVPMVDQGSKGYCAAAVSERVLRYYGHAVDEHEIAQMAGSSALGGTSIAEMKATVKAVGSKCRLGYNEIVSFVASYDDLVKEIGSYNKIAEKANEKVIDIEQYMVGGMVDLGQIKLEMNPKILKKMREKDPRFKKFIAGITRHISLGVPVIWGVEMGIYPEPECPQARGGHMRLIIGYNKETKEILYSDTWGAGHELKRMPEDWAFAVTHEAFLLRPL